MTGETRDIAISYSKLKLKLKMSLAKFFGNDKFYQTNQTVLLGQLPRQQVPRQTTAQVRQLPRLDNYPGRQLPQGDYCPGLKTAFPWSLK